MAGLAIGDALGRPVEGLSSAQIREKFGDVKDFLTEVPGGSDDTEYAILTSLALIKHGKTITSNQFAEFWKEKVCYQEEQFLGAGFSEMAAIQNLRNGMLPPDSGKHIHSWSDGLAMRVAPIGIVSSGDIKLATKLAIADGQVSHSGEGIYSGIAVSVGIATAMAGGSYLDVIDSALNSISKNSWTYRAIFKSVQYISNVVEMNQKDSIHHIADELVKKVATHDYVFADLAPEAVALTFAAIKHGEGDFLKTLLFAVNLGRDADTIAAMAGSILGAIVGIGALPEHWVDSVQKVEGTCLAFTKGINPVDMAEELVKL
jgi:ADP-ribosylglycohydrolase